MKKLFFSLVALMSATMMQAGLGLSVEGNLISKDTTITISKVEVDDFTGDRTMGWKGTMFYNGSLTIYIERATPCVEGYEDQFCAGSCMTGTVGQLRDTMTCNLSLYTPPIQVYAHYYPQRAEVETIRYRFVGADEDFTLTVNYDPSATGLRPTAAQKKCTKTIRNGQVVILRNDKAINILGTTL